MKGRMWNVIKTVPSQYSSTLLGLFKFEYPVAATGALAVTKNNEIEIIRHL